MGIHQGISAFNLNKSEETCCGTVCYCDNGVRGEAIRVLFKNADGLFSGAMRFLDSLTGVEIDPELIIPCCDPCGETPFLFDMRCHTYSSNINGSTNLGDVDTPFIKYTDPSVLEPCVDFDGTFIYSLQLLEYNGNPIDFSGITNLTLAVPGDVVFRDDGFGLGVQNVADWFNAAMDTLGVPVHIHMGIVNNTARVFVEYTLGDTFSFAIQENLGGCGVDKEVAYGYNELGEGLSAVEPFDSYKEYEECENILPFTPTRLCTLYSHWIMGEADDKFTNPSSIAATGACVGWDQNWLYDVVYFKYNGIEQSLAGISQLSVPVGGGTYRDDGFGLALQDITDWLNAYFASLSIPLHFVSGIGVGDYNRIWFYGINGHTFNLSIRERFGNCGTDAEFLFSMNQDQSGFNGPTDGPYDPTPAAELRNHSCVPI